MKNTNYLIPDISEALCLYSKGFDSALTYNAHLECSYQSNYKTSYINEVLIKEFGNLHNKVKLYTLENPSTDNFSTLRSWDSIAYTIWLYLKYQEIGGKNIQDQSVDMNQHIFYSQQVNINRGFLFISAIRKSLDLIFQKNHIATSVGDFIKKIDVQGLYPEYSEHIKFLYITNRLANSNKHSLLLQQYDLFLISEKTRIFGVDEFNININEDINSNNKLKFFSIAEGHLESINKILYELYIQTINQGLTDFPLIIEYNINPAQLLISYLIFIKKILRSDQWIL